MCAGSTGSRKRLLDRKRADYVAQVFQRNIWLAAAQRNRKDFDPPWVDYRHCARHIIERGANLFPLWILREKDLFSSASASGEGTTPNLSEKALDYLARLGAPQDVESLFYHTVASLHSPSYRLENAGALRQDWPRVPLPLTRELLLASAALGRRVAALLDVEGEVEGVTVGEVRTELRVVGVPEKAAGGSWAVTAGWGHAGKGGVTMPGTGRPVRRDYSAAERAELEAGAAALGLSPEQLYAALGESTVDVYLNDAAYWRNIPRRVWEYTIGGYQVIKKWLSYREQALLGRPLEVAEVREVRDMARRIAGILLLEGELDKNYGECKG